MRNRPDGTRKADFAEIDAIGGKGKTGKRRNERSRHRQVGSRLRYAIAACNIEIDVMLAETNAAVGFQNGKDHGKAGSVPPDDRPTGRAERCWRHKRLDFD